MQQICRGGQRGPHVQRTGSPVSWQSHLNWRRTEKALKMWKMYILARVPQCLRQSQNHQSHFTAEVPELLAWNLLTPALQNQVCHVFYVALHLSVLKSLKPDLFPQNSNHYIFHNKSGRRKPSSRQGQRANKHHYLD